MLNKQKVPTPCTPILYNINLRYYKYFANQWYTFLFLFANFKQFETFTYFISKHNLFINKNIFYSSIYTKQQTRLKRLRRIYPRISLYFSSCLRNTKNHNDASFRTFRLALYGY